MKIIKNLKVPTGNIFVAEGESGKVEFISLADYGKDVNLNQNKPVPDGLPLMPLTEKWVVTISSQTSCCMNCEFCDVPNVGKVKNCSFNDLKNQILLAISQPNTPKTTKRLNIHIARMGEPTWNIEVINLGYWIGEELKSYNPHPVVSTMMPKNNKDLRYFIEDWVHIKNSMFDGNAGLQLSINSTDEIERKKIFNNNACSIREIADIMGGIKPKGRKITLNFAVADYIVEPKALIRYFSPSDYIIKLTPMHKTTTAVNNKVETMGDYTSPEPYIELEKKFKNVGYDTLVFIASNDEDLGRITCGNAILSGTMPHKYKEIICQY